MTKNERIYTIAQLSRQLERLKRFSDALERTSLPPIGGPGCAFPQCSCATPWKNCNVLKRNA